jgi:hypothetical protein
MSNITTRAGKGSPLTNNELDANFTNLNSDKVEIGGDLSGTSSAPNVAKIQGRAVSTDAPAAGEKLVWNGTAWEPSTEPTGEPIGHADKTQSSISFNSGTRTFTIAPVATEFVVWCKGVKYTYTSAQTVVIPNTTGLHFIYFNQSGVLSTQMSYFTWEDHAPTAYVYWNATTSTAVYFGDERHGITLDWQTHEYLHRTRGAAIANGFGASGYTTTGLGATDADAQIDIGGGTFFDEDMQVDIVSTNTPVANTWQQDLSGPARIPVLYLSGNAWVIDAPTDFPFKVVGGIPQYNLYSGGTWSTASVNNNEYFVSWILATNNLNYPVVSIISQAATNQVSQAEAMTFEGLSLSGFPSVEFRPLYKVIYQHRTSFTNSVKVSTIAVYDLRSLQSAGVAAALVQDHGNLSGLGDDDHAQYLHVSEVRSPTQSVKNSFLPSQTSNGGKYLSTDGTNPSWVAIPSGSLDFTGDVTGTGTTGSPVALTLANSGVTAGTYSKVTVDGKGRVTVGTNIASGDVTTALGFTPENAANKGVANGYVGLDGSGKIASSHLPSYVDDVLEYANLAAFPATGDSGKIYIAIDSAKVYRWSGSVYVEISASPGSTDAVPEGSTNLYHTTSRVRTSISASGSLSYNNTTGVFSYTQPTNVSTFTNDSGYLTGITGSQVTTALGYTPPQPNGTGASGTWNISISGNAATVSSITSGQVTAALGYTPYNATNPAGYTTNVGTVYSVSGTGTVSGLTLTGSVTSSGSLTLGGTLTLTSGQVTTALGYTPYNSTNPSGYITSSALSSYLPLSGGTLTGVTLIKRNLGTNDYTNVGQHNLHLRLQRNSDLKTLELGVLDNGTGVIQANEAGVGYNTLALNPVAGNVTVNGETVLHGGNYNVYAPTKSGGGASGTWSINVTGNAATATTSSQLNSYPASSYSGPTSTIKQFFWNDLSASGTQARTFEIARLGVDYNDWNTGSGPFEVELYEGYYSRGLKKKYVIYWGYTNSYGIQLVEYSGNGDNNFQCRIGTPVQASGDNYYLPVFVDVRYYAYCDVRVTTNRDITTSNPPSIGTTFINSSPSATNISDFTADSTVNFASTTAVQINGNQLLHAANYSSYALPLTGGTLTGNLSFSNGGDRLIQLGSTTNWNYNLKTEGDQFRLYDGNGTNFLYAVYNGGGTGKYLQILGSNLVVFNNGSVTASGNQLLHAGNVGTYALPLGGGTLTGSRPIEINTSGGFIAMKGDSGGWSMGTYYKGSAGTTRAGFGAYGGGDSLTYAWIGTGYESPWMTLNGSGINSSVLLTGPAARFTNDGASRVLYLRGSGNIVQFEDAAGTYKWELVGRDGSFYVYKNDGTGAGHKWQIDGNGNSATTGNWNFGGAIQQGGNQVLHAGNFTSYTPYTYPGWPGSPGTDANSYYGGNWVRSSFTYSNNANHTGAIVHFPAGGYDLQLNGTYNGQQMSFRSRNGDTGGWNTWRQVLHDGNYSSFALPLSGGTLTGFLGLGYGSGGGEWLRVSRIRGVGQDRSGDYMHLYERVHIGYPSGWGGIDAPSYGLSTWGGADLAVGTGFVRVTTGSLGVGDAGTRGLIFDGNYTNGQFRHRFRKEDPGAGLPLYIDYAHGTANTFTNIARFGGGGTYREFSVFGTMSCNNGYVSDSNPWGTSNSAYFQNGITTANTTNWIYGHNYLGNAPSNGSGAQIESNGKYYSQVSSGVAMHVRSTRATSETAMIVEQNRGDHSWGIVSEFRVGADAGTDRPSVLFSSGHNSDTWTVGFGYVDSNFRINRDHGYRNGNWGTTLMTLDRSGNVTFAGNVTAYSDRRLKQNIKRIGSASEIVRQLEGVSFEYIEDGRRGIGLIAQDVELVLPELVGESTTSTGETYKNVAYSNIVAVLIEAVKELQVELAEVKGKLH